jgi:hypothetical protein
MDMVPTAYYTYMLDCMMPGSLAVAPGTMLPIRIPALGQQPADVRAAAAAVTAHLGGEHHTHPAASRGGFPRLAPNKKRGVSDHGATPAPKQAGEERRADDATRFFLCSPRDVRSVTMC